MIQPTTQAPNQPLITMQPPHTGAPLTPTVTIHTHNVAHYIVSRELEDDTAYYTSTEPASYNNAATTQRRTTHTNGNNTYTMYDTSVKRTGR